MNTNIFKQANGYDSCHCLFSVYHRYDLQMKTRLLGFGKGPKKEDIQPMNPDRAVELGAEMIGEVSIYVFALSLLLIEQYYSAKSSEKKQNDVQNQIQDLQNHVNDLSISVATLDAELRKADRTITELSSQNLALQQKVFGKKK